MARKTAKPRGAGEGRKGLRIDPASAGEHPTPFVTLFLVWRLRHRPAYGYALLQEMRGMRVSGKKSSTIYATLGKLEKAGLVKSRLEKTGARVRRLYLTTEKGWAMFERIRRRHIHGLLRDFIRTLAGRED